MASGRVNGPPSPREGGQGARLLELQVETVVSWGALLPAIKSMLDAMPEL